MKVKILARITQTAKVARKCWKATFEGKASRCIKWLVSYTLLSFVLESEFDISLKVTSDDNDNDGWTDEEENLCLTTNTHIKLLC